MREGRRAGLEGGERGGGGGLGRESEGEGGGEGERQVRRGKRHLEGLVHDAFLLGQGLPVFLHLLHAAPHLHASIFFIQASLPQLTHLPHNR